MFLNEDIKLLHIEDSENLELHWIDVTIGCQKWSLHSSPVSLRECNITAVNVFELPSLFSAVNGVVCVMLLPFCLLFTAIDIAGKLGGIHSLLLRIRFTVSRTLLI